MQNEFQRSGNYRRITRGSRKMISSPLSFWRCTRMGTGCIRALALNLSHLRVLCCLWCMLCAGGVVVPASGILFAQEGLQTAGAVEFAEQLAAMKRTDFQGKDWTWSELSGEKGTVVVFLGTQCPLAKLYTRRIEELSTKYSQRGVRFVAVDSNVQDSLAEMAAHARKHQLTIPFVKDPDQALADLLGATRTPEVCVLDTNAELKYRGRIDDQFGIGYAKEKETASELIDAMEAILSGREVPTSVTTAPGCLIGRVHHKKSDAVAGVPITYAEHVAPVLQAHCVSCHREGDIGPMDLSTYEDAAAWAEMIVEVTQNRTMPPWHATQDNAKFSNDRTLSEKELSILEQWAAGGTEPGDLQKVTRLIAATSGWLLPKEPDLVIPMSEDAYRVPKEGTVNYQYFRADVGNDKDLWVRGLEILPGARDVVHHVLVFVAPKGMRKRDLGGARTFLAGYVPGTRAELMPSGYAKRIPANSELVFQVHYTPNGTAMEDLSKLGLLFADEQSVTHEVITTSAVNLRFSIPPGAANHAVTATLPEKLPECELLSFSPHMHVRGKSFKYTIMYPDRRREVVLDIPHYDFNWQTEYRLASPIKVPAGTRMRCDAAFDNSDGNLNNPDSKAWVSWGDQTYEEMMIGYFHYAVKR